MIFKYLKIRYPDSTEGTALVLHERWDEDGVRLTVEFHGGDCYEAPSPCWWLITPAHGFVCTPGITVLSAHISSDKAA